MTQEEKISYMRIACNLCEFGIKEEDLDLLISLYELVIETQGEANIKDVLKTKSDVQLRRFDKNMAEIEKRTKMQEELKGSTNKTKEK